MLYKQIMSQVENGYHLIRAWNIHVDLLISYVLIEFAFNPTKAKFHRRDMKHVDIRHSIFCGQSTMDTESHAINAVILSLVRLINAVVFDNQAICDRSISHSP